MHQTIKAGVIGATGYAGVELVRLLAAHPIAQVTAVSSVSYEGKMLAEVYPAFAGTAPLVLQDEDAVIAASDVVFASLPHGLSEPLAKKCVAQGKRLIDLGADFRLYSEADYQQWYGLNYTEKVLHAEAVYALPELYRDKIAGARILGNPGCYPTSIALALAPLLRAGAADTDTLVIDSKSGVTGAGRTPGMTTHYPECNESCAPYKIAQHRHTPEIEQTLSDLAGKPVRVTFVPHLLPVNRGILSTIYCTLAPDVRQSMTFETLHALYCEAYQNEPFVRVLPQGEIAAIKNVKYSNYCDISLHLDTRTGRAVLVSAIDNMVKGAAGQAIQNMNLLFGLDETTGLEMIPPSF